MLVKNIRHDFVQILPLEGLIVLPGFNKIGWSGMGNPAPVHWISVFTFVGIHEDRFMRKRNNFLITEISTPFFDKKGSNKPDYVG